MREAVFQTGIQSGYTSIFSSLNINPTFPGASIGDSDTRSYTSRGIVDAGDRLFLASGGTGYNQPASLLRGGSDVLPALTGLFSGNAGPSFTLLIPTTIRSSSVGAFCSGSVTEVYLQNARVAGFYAVDQLEDRLYVVGDEGIYLHDSSCDVPKVYSESVCLNPGESISWEGQTIQARGEYERVSTDADGCERYARLLVNRDTVVRRNHCIADDGRGFVYGSSFSLSIYVDRAGEFTETLDLPGGCTETLRVSSLSLRDSVLRLCTPAPNNDPVQWHGELYDQSGIYYDTITTGACAGVYRLELSNRVVNDDPSDYAACTGIAVQVGPQSYTFDTAGIYTVQDSFQLNGTCFFVTRRTVAVAARDTVRIDTVVSLGQVLFGVPVDSFGQVVYRRVDDGSPCGLSYAYTAVLSNSVANLSAGSIRLQPNPTPGEITVRFSSEFRSAIDGVHLDLIDLSGRVVPLGRYAASQVKLDLRDYVGPGVYTIRFTAGPSTFVKRVVLH